MQRLNLLAPLAAKAVEGANAAPIDRWRVHLHTLDRLLTQLRALSAFIDQHFAGELTGMGVKLGALAEATDAENTVSDVLRLVARWRANGTLKRLADLSDHVAAFADTVDVDALVGDLIRRSAGSSVIDRVVRTLRTPRMVGDAIDDARKQPGYGKDGGLGGLIRLLKDPEVQRSIRLYAHISDYVRQNGVKPAV